MAWLKIDREPPRGLAYVNLDRVTRVSIDADGGAWLDYGDSGGSDAFTGSQARQVVAALEYLALLSYAPTSEEELPT